MNPHEIRLRFSNRHPSTVNLLQFFSNGHLHPELRELVEPIGELAFSIVEGTKDGPELTVALRHLRDARDSLIRHHLLVNNFQLRPQATKDETCSCCSLPGLADLSE